MIHVVYTAYFVCLCVTGLQPYIDYRFVLVACTAVGCGASLPSTGRTLQALPAGTHTHTQEIVHVFNPALITNVNHEKTYMKNSNDS